MAQSKATDPMHPAGKQAPTLTPTGHFAGKPTLPISRSVTVIGARKDARLQLLSSSVSQHHALIVNADSGPYIRDLASRKHVLVNGIEVKESPLADGDEIQIGRFTFRFNESARTAPADSNHGIQPAPSGALQVDGEQIPIPIDGKTLLIGRRDTCDIPLLEDSASTCHAILFEMDGRRYVRDLGSRTGTFVNGKKIRQTELAPGDELKVGETTMRYTSDGVPASESFARTAGADLGIQGSEEEDQFLEPADINGPIHVEHDELPLAGESRHGETSPALEPAPSGAEALELVQEQSPETEPVELAPLELEAPTTEHPTGEPPTGGYPTGGHEPEIEAPRFEPQPTEPSEPAQEESAPIEFTNPQIQGPGQQSADEELADMLAMEALSAPPAPSTPPVAPVSKSGAPKGKAPKPSPAEPSPPKPVAPEPSPRRPAREESEALSNEDFLADLESLAPAPPPGSARKKNDAASPIESSLTSVPGAPEASAAPSEGMDEASAPPTPEIEHGAELNPSAAVRNSLPPGTSQLDLAPVAGDEIDLSADPDVSGPADTTALHFENAEDRPAPRLSDQIVDSQENENAQLVERDESGADEGADAIDQVLGLLPQSGEDAAAELAGPESAEGQAPDVASAPEATVPAPEASAPAPESVELSSEQIRPEPGQAQPARSVIEKVEDDALSLSAPPEPAEITQPIEGISFEPPEVTSTDAIEEEVGISPTLAERAGDQPVTFGQTPEAPALPEVDLSSGPLGSPDVPDTVLGGEASVFETAPVPELPVAGKGAKSRRKRKPRRRKTETTAEAEPLEAPVEQDAASEASGDEAASQAPTEEVPPIAAEATMEPPLIEPSAVESARDDITFAEPIETPADEAAPVELGDEIAAPDVQAALDRERAQARADSSVEVLAPTAPEPESALPLEQAEADAPAPLLEPGSLEPESASPSDTGFARAVSDFASEETGPLVEETGAARVEIAPAADETVATPAPEDAVGEESASHAEAPAPLEAQAPSPAEEDQPEIAALIEEEDGLASPLETEPTQYPAGASQLDLEPIAPADLHVDEQAGDHKLFDLTPLAPEEAAKPAPASASAPEPLEIEAAAETAQAIGGVPTPAAPSEPELHLEAVEPPVPAQRADQVEPLAPSSVPDAAHKPAPAGPQSDATGWGANQDHFFGGTPLKLGPGSASRPSEKQPGSASVAPAARAPASGAPPRPQPRKSAGDATTRIPPRPAPRTGPTTTSPFADGKRRAINAGDRQVRTAFDGLAFSPVRQADVFGHAQVPGSLTAGFDPSLMNDVFGGAAIRRGLKTPTGVPPTVPPAGQAPREGDESAQGASRGPNPKRMPAAIPEPSPRAKKRRWFGLLGLFLLAILGCVAATAGIYSQVPVGSSVSGTLRFANMDSVTRQERKSIGESLLASMEANPNVRAEFDLDKGALTLTDAGSASQSDQQRMLELLRQVYQKNQQSVAEASGLRDTVTALKSAMEATQKRIDDYQHQIDALKIVMPSASDRKQLESEVSRLESAYNESVATVARLSAELEQLRARPSAPSQTNAAPKPRVEPAPEPKDHPDVAPEEPVVLHPDPRWKNDPGVKKLVQQQEIQMRRYNAAMAAGLADDAANLKTRLAALNQGIRAREAALGGQELAQAAPKTARAPRTHRQDNQPVMVASLSIAGASPSASSDAPAAPKQLARDDQAIQKKQQELNEAQKARDQAAADFHAAEKRLRDLNARIDSARAAQEKRDALARDLDRQKQSLIQQQKQYELQTQQARSTPYPLEPSSADVTADVEPDPRPRYILIACGSIVVAAGVLALLLVLKTRARRPAHQPFQVESLSDLPDYPTLAPSRRSPAEQIPTPATDLVEV